ncbi:OsmC family peroxiredoxin [Sphingomonas sp. MAH-20]|uniref:OsmC family peroxiredoxin n=1 Tax=Sphingomonas horti TaxID=2682842 RepID=A0A6I4J2Y4_9SPHN|nr:MULTISPECIES: OsmC family protein [Sphingomonas]MBA2919573.1 OsmC family protein [Sphingomonas sp. CGMCC 1.13658]MVO78453.1 OsmC family peroxiredoxin [Sphingomonas horti]
MVRNDDPAAVNGVVARATGTGLFQTRIAVRETVFLTDEPVAVGGEGSGPTPYELLSAALAACTSMTLRLYAKRKGWELPAFSVEVAHEIVPGGRPRDRLNRQITFEGPLPPAAREKLLEIADKCPVHRTLVGGFEVRSYVGQPEVHPAGDPVVRHEQEMERACDD